MDTLAKFGSFGIDWARQTLGLGDAKLIVEQCSHGFVLSPVVVALISDHVIPPRSQCFIHVGTTDYVLCDKNALFSPFMDKMGHLNVLLGASVVHALKTESQLQSRTHDELCPRKNSLQEVYK